MKARPPLAVSTPSTTVSAPPPPQPSSTYVVQGQNGVMSPPSYTVSSATHGPLTTPKYQTLPAVQYIQHPVGCVVMCICCPGIIAKKRVISNTVKHKCNITRSTQRTMSTSDIPNNQKFIFKIEKKELFVK